MAGNRQVVKDVRRHVVPTWWRDAKLGIFIHWTPSSVPGYAPIGSSVGELLASGRRDAMAFAPYSEWYENALRFPGSPTARHHAKQFAGRAYQAFAAEWEDALGGWDPDSWADQFLRAGARYVVLVAKHHDGYCLWPTAITNPRRPGWNCKRDVVGELAEAVRGRGMRFGVYYSGGLDWTFNDHAIGTFSDLLAAEPRGDYIAYADAQVRELITRYQPSILWNDIAWPARAGDLARLFADYYRRVPDGVVNDRFMPWSPALAAAGSRPGRQLLDRFVARSAGAEKGVVPPRPPMYDVRTPEYTVFGTIQREPWECVRGMDKGFGYNRESAENDFLAHGELLWSLVDIASKGGNLLLNVGPKGEDATIPPPQIARLDWLADFIAEAGPAVYASRPWVTPAGLSDDCDLRYTARDQDVFAFVRPRAVDDAAAQVLLPHLRAGHVTRVSRLDGSELRHEAGPTGLTVRLDRPATPERPAVLAIRGASAGDAGS